MKDRVLTHVNKHIWYYGVAMMTIVVLLWMAVIDTLFTK